jgi:lantibiotic leader peptide-processing serine protease
MGNGTKEGFMPKKGCRRALVAVAALALMLGLAGIASAAKYVVLYKAKGVPADGGAVVRSAGGTVVASYAQIGVIIAQSSSPSFREEVLQDARVQGVSATAGFAAQIPDTEALAGGPPAGDLPNAPAADADTFSSLQWDMRQMSAPQAHGITGGSPSVLVGDLDTGLDYTHPDLAANVDFASSVSCVGGVPDQTPAAWDDDNGHGTHTAGTIAAAANGIGIVGVAPNVKIAGVKVGNADGFFFPEAVVCGFMWAATHGFDVTNNSYFADPWYFNCRNDPEQRAIWKAESRAIEYAERQGVTVVAALGNFDDDLAHPTRDVISPDTGPGEPRDISNACGVVPTEVPGVIGVTATGDRRLKSYYSNYGSGVADVAAPGGDRVLQVTTDAPNGRVLSTYPAKFAVPSPLILQDCSVTPCAVYAYLQGTSMASPHVAGLAALVISRYGTMSTGKVAAIIGQTADSQACPDADTLALYAPFVSVSNGEPQTCEGGKGYNSWYGHGIVNALSAVTHSP